MIRNLTCIVCPKGCPITVELDDNKNIISVKGFSCKRGEMYARTECTAPMRTLTTTVALAGGGVIPVKTDNTVPKELLFKCMEVINGVTAPADAKLGDIVVENILDTGANVVVTGKGKINNK